MGEMKKSSFKSIGCLVVLALCFSEMASAEVSKKGNRCVRIYCKKNSNEILNEGKQGYFPAVLNADGTYSISQKSLEIVEAQCKWHLNVYPGKDTSKSALLAPWIKVKS